MANLQSIANVGDQKRQIESYKEALHIVLSKKDAAGARSFVDHSRVPTNVKMPSRINPPNDVIVDWVLQAVFL